MIIQNFSLKKIKKELSPIIGQLKGKSYSNFIKGLHDLLDQRLLDNGEGYAEEYFTSKQRKAISTIFSFIAHEGLSHAGSVAICSKAGVSYPTLKLVLDKLVELQLILVFKCKKFGQQSANLYISPYHDNFNSIAEYLNKEFEVEFNFDPILYQDFIRFFDRFEAEIPCNIKENSDAKVSNCLISSNSVKNNSNDLHVEHMSHAINSNFVGFESSIENEKEAYCTAAGVPNQVTNILSKGLSTTHIIKIWESMQNTLKKYGHLYADLQDEISLTLRRTVLKYKKLIRSNPGLNFDFAGCICGYMIKYVFSEPSSTTPTSSEDGAEDIAKPVRPTIANGRFKPNTKGYSTQKPQIEIVRRSEHSEVTIEEFEEVMRLAKELQSPVNSTSLKSVVY